MAGKWRDRQRYLLIAFLFISAHTFADDQGYRVPEPLRDLGLARKVRLVYFVPSDREPTANYQEKITTLMTFVADLYRQDFRRHGWENAGPDFEFRDGKLHVEFLRGKQAANQYVDEAINSQKQWEPITQEISAAYGPQKDNLYVVFTETYGDGSAEFEWPGGIALGGQWSANGGQGLFSAWVLRDEFCATTVARQLELLNDSTPIVGRTAHHNRQPDSPRFEFIEDGFGAVAHELGHAFGLPHDTRRDTQDIMGNGFRYLRFNYLNRFQNEPRVGFSADNFRLLRWSRFFSEEREWPDGNLPTIKATHPKQLAIGATELKVKLEITDDVALGALAFFSPGQDSVVGGSELSGTRFEGETTFTIPPLKAGDYTLRFIATDRSGNQATLNVKIPVE